MRIQNDWQPVGQPIAAALGSFDGLHRGQRPISVGKTWGSRSRRRAPPF